MHDGYQVLRFANNYKSKDLYLIGNEMNNRIGTGNYDPERTKFNIRYKDLERDNLYQEVKYKLESRNIEYLHKTKTNLLNGVTISSGPEFFMTLGLPFKETERTYKTGEKKGQNILVPDIKSKDDIPSEVIKYFDESYNFLKLLVGEENIVMAQVHFDEDTPHLQAYFLPVVDEVKRKCYQRDNDGNLIKEIKKDKKGNDKLVPILLRDSEGKMVYEKVKGNFLNNDQFWKNLGGRESFSKIQDDFNKYINSKGFNLDRGNVGANKRHQTKLEYEINELKAEKEQLENELINYKDEINNIKKMLEVTLKESNSELKKKIIGYSKKEVEKLIDDFDNLSRLNLIKTIESNDKDQKINSLSVENNFYKNNRRLIKSEQIRYKKTKELDYYKNAVNKLTNALDIVLKMKPLPFIEDYVSLAEEINAGNRLQEEDQEAWEEFQKTFAKEEDKCL